MEGLKHNWQIVKYNGLKIYYLPALDGGGRDFVHDYQKLVKQLFGKVDKVCEFASGCGFIGFSLLASGLCQKLCLIDVNPQAIKCCIKTIKSNGLKNVTAYVCDVFDKIPKDAKWDLVVGNPPHFNGTLKEYQRNKILIDPGWRIHKEFYKGISRFLSNKGSVLLVENFKGSSPKIWQKIINKNHLSFVKTILPKRNFLQKFKEIIRIIYSLKWQDFKNAFSFYKTRQRKIKNYKILTQMFSPHYYVWSKKNI